MYVRNTQNIIERHKERNYSLYLLVVRFICCYAYPSQCAKCIYNFIVYKLLNMVDGVWFYWRGLFWGHSNVNKLWVLLGQRLKCLFEWIFVWGMTTPCVIWMKHAIRMYKCFNPAIGLTYILYSSKLILDNKQYLLPQVPNSFLSL